MGYSAQVQQSPNQQFNQASGKSGAVGQVVDQVQPSPPQQNYHPQPSGKGGPVGQVQQNAPRAPDQQLPVGMSQADMGGFDSDGAPHQSTGKGGNYSMSATSGQPRMGVPNAYSNTVGMGDNMQQQLPKAGIGKGKV